MNTEMIDLGRTSALTRNTVAAVVAMFGACVAFPAIAQQEGWIPKECGPEFEEANIIVGTEGNDSILGTAGNDVILGLGGDDKIHGGAGDDCLVGGNGNDFVFGGPGNDILVANGDGNGGPNTGDAIHERNRLNGSRGTDTCYGSYGYFYTSEDRPAYRTTFDNCEVIYEPRQNDR